MTGKPPTHAFVYPNRRHWWSAFGARGAMVGLLLAVTVVITPSADAATRPSASPAALVPRPFNVESTLKADLDGDGDLDVVLVGVDGPAVLPETQEGDNADGIRVLVVARKDAEGYRRVGLGPDALECRRCGGAFWGGLSAPVELATMGGGFTTAQSAGAREITDWTHRYRIENGRVRLIGLDIVNTDRGDGSVVARSTNLLTGVTITTVEGQPQVPVKAGRVKGKPRVVYLESVKLG